MDTAQWAQGIGVVKQQPVVEGSIPKPPMTERKARPQNDQALNCPRCNSTNTKFCYYNNYSLSQPRYFCKTCRRYWTEGGSLRNVPVGGGSRKNKRSSSSSSSAIPSKKLPDLNPKIQQGQDLNLACPPPPAPEDYNNSISKFIEVPFSAEDKTTHSHHHDQLSSMELLKTTGIPSSRTLCSLMPMSASDSSCSTMYNSSGFPNLQDFKPPPPGLSFSLEGFANGYGGISGMHEGSSGDGGARLLFPTDDLKRVPSSTDHYEQNRSHADSTGFWNSMLGGGSW